MEKIMIDSNQTGDTYVVPPPDIELRRLSPLLGKWETNGQTLTTELIGSGVPVDSKEEFYWLEGNYFLVQPYATTFGDEPTQKGINYWYYDTEAKRFRIIFFSNNGPYTEDGNRYEGIVDGNTLTFEGPARFQYQLDEDGRIKANDDGTITTRWWLSNHKGEWEKWMTNINKKRS
jgi:hypothetical protein